MNKIHTATYRGLECIPVVATARTKPGTGRLSFPGTSETREREARVRVASACVSLAPSSDVDVEITYEAPSGSVLGHEAAFDMAAALLVLSACGYEVDEAPGIRYACELGLDGSARPVRGASVLARGADIVLAPENAADLLGEYVRHHRRIFVGSLADAARLSGRPPIVTKRSDRYELDDLPDPIADKCLSLAGGALLLGPPGSGKTISARRVAARLDPMTIGDAEISRDVWSVAGVANGFAGRPFRAPHHTASEAGLVGTFNRPGEASLAHGGVLFLDELNEFRRSSILALARVLRAGEAVSVRGPERCSFPARPAKVIGSVARCLCGRYPGNRCNCTREMRDRWDAGVSWFADTLGLERVVMP